MKIKYVTSHSVMFDRCYVCYSDGSFKSYDAVALGCAWFQMSNDAFFSLYGFNFNPHQWGLYEKCKKIVQGN